MTQVREPKVDYWEFTGGFEPRSRATLAGDAVIFSNLEKCSAWSPPASGLCVRYVARGRENYRIGGRSYRVDAGQVMVVPQELGAECDFRSTDLGGTVGLCTLVSGATDDLQWKFGPLVLGRECTPVGQSLHKSAESLWRGVHKKGDVARQLIASLRSNLPAVATSIARQAAVVEAAKPATRFEMVRRANLAQAYLHSITGRAIDLDELSAAVGASPFRLLAAFQRCFSETPASYHRKLRLNLALDEARRRGVPISSVADEFGFAGSSSFSHAYRRAFGHAPVWKKTGPAS